MTTLFEAPPQEPSLPQKKRTPDELLDELNPQQRQAVLHAGSPLLIVAGAGSGKTQVLTSRSAYLLTALVGRRANVMWVSTFHAMCVRIMRREAKHLGLSTSFSIYDQDDSRRLVGLVARDLDLDPKRYPARGLAAQISNLKNELLDAD